MRPFTTIHGPAAALMRANIDTDVIIRIERLTGLSREELGRYAFEVLARRADGSEDPDFVLNQPAFRSAPVLLAGPNFGCGSSREPAVWALLARGIRCVVAESFGDIFLSNCYQNGLLPMRLTRAQLERICACTSHGQAVTVDLRESRLMAGEAGEFTIEIDPIRREAMLQGLDDISSTMRKIEAIEQWQRSDRLARPWVW